MKLTENLRNFVRGQVPEGRLLQSDMAYVYLGDKRHGFYVWALRGGDPKLLVDQFRRDIHAWVVAAGEGCTIVMRRWPEMELNAEGSHELTCRMLIVNRHPYYNSVEPSFVPKTEDGEVQVFGGTDES